MVIHAECPLADICTKGFSRKCTVRLFNDRRLADLSCSVVWIIMAPTAANVEWLNMSASAKAPVVQSAPTSPEATKKVHSVTPVAAADQEDMTGLGTEMAHLCVCTGV